MHPLPIARSARTKPFIFPALISMVDAISPWGPP